MAAWAAALIGSGTSKCGWPMLRLTGSFRLRRQLEDLADARNLDVPHPLGDPVSLGLSAHVMPRVSVEVSISS